VVIDVGPVPAVPPQQVDLAPAREDLLVWPSRRRRSPRTAAGTLRGCPWRSAAGPECVRAPVLEVGIPQRVSAIRPALGIEVPVVGRIVQPTFSPWRRQASTKGFTRSRPPRCCFVLKLPYSLGPARSRRGGAPGRRCTGSLPWRRRPATYPDRRRGIEAIRQRVVLLHRPGGHADSRNIPQPISISPTLHGPQQTNRPKPARENQERAAPPVWRRRCA